MPKGSPAGRYGPRRWDRSRGIRPEIAVPQERLVNLIHDALGPGTKSRRADDRIVLIGEDIEGPYGGAFKVDQEPEPGVSRPGSATPRSARRRSWGSATAWHLRRWFRFAEIMFGGFS